MVGSEPASLILAWVIDQRQVFMFLAVPLVHGDTATYARDPHNQFFFAKNPEEEIQPLKKKKNKNFVSWRENVHSCVLSRP